MGARANYVVVDADGWQLYYSHWGAQYVHLQLAAGPAEALRFVRVQHRRDPTHWLDSAWGEGGALIDLPRRRLIFFATQALFELDLRRAYLALLARTWPGWTVRYACEGLVELAGAVGVDPAVVRNDRFTDDERAAELVAASPEDLADGGWFLVTERRADGVVRDWAVRGVHLEHPAWTGRRVLDAKPGAGASARATSVPRGGVHLDLGRRSVAAWTAESDEQLRDEMTRAWAGWEVAFWGDDYERHVAQAGLPLPVVDVAAGFDRLLPILTGDRPDPFAGLEAMVAHLQDQGEAVEVTADAVRHVEVHPALRTNDVLRAALAAARRDAGLSSQP